jgi:hypothetical protein
MTAILFLLVIASWALAFLDMHAALRFLVVFAFGFAGGLMVFFGGLSLWWDSSMQPSKASPFLLIAGILVLVPHGIAWLRSTGRGE